MKFKIEVTEGKIIPKWYGIGYRKYDLFIAYAYPIPFNLLIIFAVFIWAFLKNPIRMPREREALHAYLEGYEKGKTEGFEKGEVYIRNKVLKDIEERKKQIAIQVQKENPGGLT